MTRRTLIIVSAAIAAILAVLAGLWLARAPLAGHFGRAWLEQRGVEAGFEVQRLDLTGAVLRDVRLGDSVIIPRLEAEFRLGELRRGVVRTVRLTRPQIRVDLTDDGIFVAGFRVDDLAGGEGEAPIGLISVTGGLVTLASSAGALPMDMHLEGGPRAGWRGWAIIEPGAVAWRGWRTEVREGEIEFEMIGDRLLARAALALDGAGGPRFGAESAVAAATVRLAGLAEGAANARGEAALNIALAGARAAAPEAEAETLLAASRWRDMPGVGPLAAPLRDRLAGSLAGFDAGLAATMEISPATVLVTLETPARVAAAAGPALELRAAADGPVLEYRRLDGAWRLSGALSMQGEPDLDLPRLDILYDDGLAMLRTEGELAPFGGDGAMLGAENLSAEWRRTPEGWGAQASGRALISTEIAGMTLRRAALSGAVTAASEDGAWRLESGAAPVSLTMAELEMQSMHLFGLRLDAPRGGLILTGAGGEFRLQNSAPLAASLDRVRGGGWTALGVTASNLNGVRDPLLQRTESGETFFNALAEIIAVQSYALDTGTELRDAQARNVRLSGPVLPEMELDVAAPALRAMLDTFGQEDMAVETGEWSAILSFAPGEPLAMRFDAVGGYLTGEVLPVVLSQMRARGAATFGTPLAADIEIGNAAVAVPSERTLVSPATLSGGLTVESGNVAMRLSGAIEGAPAGSLRVTLAHDLDTGLGDMLVDVPRIEFRPGGTQPQNILPVLRGMVANAAGPAEARFHAEWYGAAVRSSGLVVLDRLDFATRFGPVQQVSTRFEMTSLAPPLTPGPQSVSIGVFNPGLPLAGGNLAISLLPEGRIGFERAEWPFSGGTIAVAPFVWDPAAETNRASLLAERLNLGLLVGMFDNEALSAGGTVSGSVPIAIREGNIFIENARLTGDDDGFVSYRGEATDAAAQSNEQANLAFRALENLRYRVLEVGLDGPVAGEMQLHLNIEGFNPDVLDGYPFRFNIGLSADLMRLVTETTQGFRIQRQIEDALRAEEGVAPANDD